MAALAGALFVACSAPTPQPVFHADDNPGNLGEWGMLERQGDRLVLGKSSVVYDLNSALFSDYTGKLRTVYMPDGMSSSLAQDGDRIIFPVGTIISKTFYYQSGANSGEVKKSDTEAPVENGAMDISGVKLVETRLLVRREAGWDALPYVWNDAQTEAILSRTGDLKKFTLTDGDQRHDFPYLVPNVNQCAGCHATNNTTRKVVPIGPKLRNLKTVPFKGVSRPDGFPVNVDWTDQSQTLEARARAYLDINCSHCHNKVGPADTSGLHLEPDTAIGPHLGVCKSPIAAGTGTGNRKLGIVPGHPEKSIFSYRLASTNPAEMMPELGRSLAHDEGVNLIADWIAAMDGDCNADL